MPTKNAKTLRRELQHHVQQLKPLEVALLDYLANPLPGANGEFDDAEETDKLEREVSPVIEAAENLLRGDEDDDIEERYRDMIDQLEEAGEVLRSINARSGARYDFSEVFPDRHR